MNAHASASSASSATSGTPSAATAPAPGAVAPRDLPGERGEFLRSMAEQRANLLITVRGLDDERTARRTTVSELTLGGLLRHVTQGERTWIRILADGEGRAPEGMFDMDQYRMREDDTLAALVADYKAAARATEETVAGLPGLDVTVPLPHSPWGPPETVHWSARRILLHIVRETAQHAGHADIIREALDGASTTAQMIPPGSAA
ncbi:DinB family protein [Streptomyces xinghaiensis]|uniref:DinB family protein n=1 Tax=Streptomyces xinghaiensis TaxID=1038928 RepID=UPI001EDDB801|nr:DinB family protein [Streptomyces xinghaiensis]